MKRHSASYLFVLTLVLLLATASRLSAQTVMWDANSEPDVAGYILYYGNSSGAYSNQVDVGNRTSYNLSIDWSRTWFFAVQAYSTAGLTSPLSGEVQWTPIATPSQGTRLTALDVSASNPYVVGQTVTWTATGTNSTTPVEYRFWLLSGNQWRMVQDYSQSNIFTWVPTWTDLGPHNLQVWARAAGSKADYEAWLGTPHFDVMSTPMEVSADVDFPTPPNNPVNWTAKVAGSGNGGAALEYQFWVLDVRAGTWTVMRQYAASPEAVWVPTAAGQYAVQAWARRVGTTAAYDSWAGSGVFTVSSNPLEVTRLDANTDFPALTGTSITWTARAKGGTAGPLQYQFWVYSNRAWAIAQPWSSTKTFTWQPNWADAGTHALQVWVKNAGSVADYDAWKGTGFFEIQPAPLNFSPDKEFPLAPGTTVRWKAEVPDPTVGFQYSFWVYGQTTGTWTLAQPYSLTNTFDWTPTAGTYALQAWARRNGSTATYDLWRGTNFLTVGLLPVKVHSLLPNKTLPARTNTTIKWTAVASGGSSGPLQYQFWRYDTTGWTVVQSWGTSNTYTWTPSSTDAGPHALQVWVRSAGSSAQDEAYGATGYFTIVP